MNREPEFNRFDGADGRERSPCDGNSAPLDMAVRNELCDLIGALLEEQLDASGQDRLLDLLSESDAAVSFYVAEMNRHAGLAWEWGMFAEDAGSPTESLQNPIIDLSPLPSHLSPSFVGGPVFSYMVASLVLCAMLLGAWAHKITHVRPMSPETAVSPFDRTAPARLAIGRITDMKDCVWRDEGAGTMAGAAVTIGRNYALSAGMLEITYDGGAKVILEGPCDYTVDSDAGGYLSVGKLVAKVEKKVASGQWPVAGKEWGVESGEWRVEGEKSSNGLAASAASEKLLATSHRPLATNPQPPAPSPQPLFSVRTPSAIVTDLGTEFGVEVNGQGETFSHVFRGSVRVQSLSGGVPEEGRKKEIVLHRDESAMVGKAGGTHETNRGQTALEVTRLTLPAALPIFVRRIRELPKQLDLLDIVAGGDGTGRRRERGIDPATGKQDTWFVDGQRTDDHAYHSVAWHPLIDGVFMPYVPTSLPPQPQGVRLDSAGHTFDRFLEGRPTKKHPNLHCTLHGDTIGGVWSRAADSTSGRGWIYQLDNGSLFMPERRGLLGMHANVGLTFDLAAMREMYEGTYPIRLHGNAGLGDGARKYADDFGMADLWIFVDGKLEWVRKDITAKDGPIALDVPLGRKSNFLTIVSTNGQRGKSYDWMVIGDPVLEMISNDVNDHNEESLSDKKQPRKEERQEK